MGSRSAVNQSGRDVDGLVPAGTVTLLAAKVEDSSRPREAEPDQMSAVARLDDAVWDIVAAHHGMRPVDGSERDSFVLGFTRASDALACAVELQRMALPAPIPAAHRLAHRRGAAARRRQLGFDDEPHRAPARLGARRPDRAVGHDPRCGSRPAPRRRVANGSRQAPLAGSLARPERVMQVCRPDLCNEFPPLQTLNVCAEERF